jgi:predicted nuclease of predicted toxin-antitoxin system
MTGKFLVDANLPVALAQQLAGSGVDCVHVADLADLSTSDNTIWAMATAQARTIIRATLIVASSSMPSS